MVSILPKTLVSSAYMDAILLISLSISQMNIKNNMGPSTVPWGIPDITSDFCDKVSPDIIY